MSAPVFFLAGVCLHVRAYLEARMSALAYQSVYTTRAPATTCPPCPAHPTTVVAVNACPRQFSVWVPWPLQLKPQLVLRCLHPSTPPHTYHTCPDDCTFLYPLTAYHLTCLFHHRPTPLPRRYVGYASDIGESSRPLMDPKYVKYFYAVTWAYVFGDVAYRGYLADQHGHDKVQIPLSSIWLFSACYLTLLVCSPCSCLSLPRHHISSDSTPKF